MALPLPFPIRVPHSDPASDAAAQAFPASSRYYAIPTARFHGDDGKVVTYLTRRFCPRGASLPLLSRVAVRGDERLDQLTARALGDPTQFWRVADANDALNPSELVRTPERVLRVPVPGYPAQTSS